MQAHKRSGATHQIYLVYVPTHTSWLNLIELWFSILVRRAIKRGNLLSLDALWARIPAFLDYFNRTTKPFCWTYICCRLTM
jgi:transposase